MLNSHLKFHLGKFSCARKDFQMNADESEQFSGTTFLFCYGICRLVVWLADGSIAIDDASSVKPAAGGVIEIILDLWAGKG